MDFQSLLSLAAGIFGGVLAFFLLDRGYNLWADRYENNDRISRGLSLLYMECRAEIRRQAAYPELTIQLGLMDDTLDYHAVILRDEWIKVPFMSIEDKALVLRAGFPPKKAHLTLWKIGRDALAAQGALREMADPHYPRNY